MHDFPGKLGDFFFYHQTSLPLPAYQFLTWVLFRVTGNLCYCQAFSQNESGKNRHRRVMCKTWKNKLKIVCICLLASELFTAHLLGTSLQTWRLEIT